MFRWRRECLSCNRKRYSLKNPLLQTILLHQLFNLLVKSRVVIVRQLIAVGEKFLILFKKMRIMFFNGTKDKCLAVCRAFAKQRNRCRKNIMHSRFFECL